MLDAPKLVRRLAAASVVVLALVLVAAAEATPKKTRFVSKRYHYTLLLPGGPGSYYNIHATGDWSGDFPPNPDFDQISNIKSGRDWLLAAKLVPKGITLKKWTAYTSTRLNPHCKLIPGHSNAKLGGAPARRYEITCPEGRVIAWAALHAHRGYWLICVPTLAKRLAAERACSAMPHTFHYTSG